MRRERRKYGIPPTVEEFAKRKGVLNIVRQIHRWLGKLGKHIVNGTAIGKYYDTLILDITHQGSEIYIDTSDETIELYGEEVSDFKEFKKVFYEHNKLFVVIAGVKRQFWQVMTAEKNEQGAWTAGKILEEFSSLKDAEEFAKKINAEVVAIEKHEV